MKFKIFIFLIFPFILIKSQNCDYLHRSEELTNNYFKENENLLNSELKYLIIDEIINLGIEEQNLNLVLINKNPSNSSNCISSKYRADTDKLLSKNIFDESFLIALSNRTKKNIFPVIIEKNSGITFLTELGLLKNREIINDFLSSSFVKHLKSLPKTNTPTKGNFYLPAKEKIELKSFYNNNFSIQLDETTSTREISLKIVINKSKVYYLRFYHYNGKWNLKDYAIV